MNKLDEILKPKITKTEAITLIKLILKRFQEIFDKNKHLCVGDWCEECPYHNDLCPFGEAFLNEAYDVVDKISEAINIRIFFDWDEHGEITIWDVKPSRSEEKWVYCYTLKFSFSSPYVVIREGHNLLIEPVTKADLREEWRFHNETTRRIFLEDALEGFFGEIERRC